MDWKDKYPQWVTKNGGVKPSTPLDIKQEIFIQRSNEIHNNKYDYSSVVYLNNSSKVVIVCPKHGAWESIPNNHVTFKNGCKKCASEALLKPEDQFLAEATALHKNKYDYSRAEYLGSHKKITISCPIHGSFDQTPHMHLRGQGCPSCAQNQLKTTEQFILDAILVHGDLYLYDELEYSKDSEKVSIRCKEHGTFTQTASAHLQGQGCPSCRNRAESNIVYIFTDGFGNYKIGISHNVQKRKNQQEKNSGLTLTLVAYKTLPGEAEARVLERQLHSLNYENPYSAEVFDGYTEWRTLSHHDLTTLIATNGFIVC